jgi:hypothetical protein
MALLYAGRFNRWIEKFFSTKEGRSSLNSISPEIQPQINIFSGEEDRYLQGWIRSEVYNQVAAVAAQFGRLQIRNPKGNQVIVVIEAASYWASATDFPALILVHSELADLSNFPNMTSARLDSRTSNSSTVVSVGATAAGFSGGAQIQRVCLANTTTDFILNPNQEMIILPGETLQFSSANVNQPANFNVMWRERVLEPSELS